MSSPEISAIIGVLEDRTTFGFNETRLDPRNVSIFTAHPKLKNTIQLFCFGTYNDYIEFNGDFINLSDKALYKLRQLTLVSEALSSSSFTFEELNRKIGNLLLHDFERFIVDSIYAKIINARLFNREKYIEIKQSIGRDVLLDGEPDSKYGLNLKRVSDLLYGLEHFNGKISKAFDYLSEIESQVEEKQDSHITHQPLVSKADKVMLNSTIPTHKRPLIHQEGETSVNDDGSIELSGQPSVGVSISHGETDINEILHNEEETDSQPTEYILSGNPQSSFSTTRKRKITK